MTTVFNYTKSPCAPDRLDSEIRASALITIAQSGGSTLLGSALTITFKTDLPNDGTAVASVTCQTAALDAVVAAHGGVALTPPAQLVTTSDPKDTDGASLTRIKATQTGNTFQLHVVEFVTGIAGTGPGALQCQDAPSISGATLTEGAQLSDVSTKFYDVTGAALLQGIQTLAAWNAALAAQAVWTVVDWEPVVTIEPIGARVTVFATPAADTYCWVIMVPDVAYASGGSKVNVQGGLNLRFLQALSPNVADGRTSKALKYSATYHTSKIRTAIKHAVGAQTRLQSIFEVYR